MNLMFIVVFLVFTKKRKEKDGYRKGTSETVRISRKKAHTHTHIHAVIKEDTNINNTRTDVRVQRSSFFKHIYTHTRVVRE